MKLLEETRRSGNTYLSSLIRGVVHYVQEDIHITTTKNISRKQAFQFAFSHSFYSNDNRW